MHSVCGVDAGHTGSDNDELEMLGRILDGREDKRCGIGDVLVGKFSKTVAISE